MAFSASVYAAPATSALAATAPGVSTQFERALLLAQYRRPPPPPGGYRRPPPPGYYRPPPPPRYRRPPPPPGYYRPPAVRGLPRAHYDWCVRKYRSYRPADNTFQPYQGRRRPCRSPFWG
ncbi:BA14K family protein [uncultured Roseibium sp.]|uniref:BA14K family protein n=1 Tax=uncultured Roseibium sp. TaxID=1936171 RepID=UPI00259ADAA9|nr:BA14K family protein [uncultured Roseibium sp.]